MKKASLILSALLFLGTLLTIPNKANADIWTFTGHWIDVYEGNATPTHSKCVWHLALSDCVVGDKKGFSIE